MTGGKTYYRKGRLVRIVNNDFFNGTLGFIDDIDKAINWYLVYFPFSGHDIKVWFRADEIETPDTSLRRKTKGETLP